MVGRRGPRQREMLFSEPSAPNTRGHRLLCEIDGLVDWESIHTRAAKHFSHTGRPSIDPVVMVKMMLVGYLFGIESDRELVEECADRLSIREFLGYGLSESLPAHASFTHWRHRLGSEFFRDVLHEIIQENVEPIVGLSEARSVDGTSVKAQAHENGPRVVVPQGRDARDFLATHADGVAEALPLPGSQVINTHDPDARLQRKKSEKADFCFQVSFCADVDTGFITDATATGLESPNTAVEHVDHDPGTVTELVADALYDHGKSLAALQERGVTPYVPKRKRNPTKLLESDAFTYDASANVYVCPMGKLLRWYRYRQDKRLDYYIALASDCKACPMKAKCTSAKRRTVTRTAHALALEGTVRSGGRYRYLSTRRRINEHLNFLGKRDHCLRRARALGLPAMRIQAAMTAIAINLKKLVRWVSRDAAQPLAAVIHPEAHSPAQYHSIWAPSARQTPCLGSLDRKTHHWAQFSQSQFLIPCSWPEGRS